MSSVPTTRVRCELSNWTQVWLQSATYVRLGLAMVRRAPGLYLELTLIYVTPALLAAMLPVVIPEPVLWRQVLVATLPWLTIVLGTLVIMVTVGYHAHGRSIGVVGATTLAATWVPRYVWTNVHTSLIFWVPISLVFAARDWQAAALPLMVVPDEAAQVLWWLVSIGLALFLHTRTLLAPFLAVHADLPATLSALEAWRLSGRHFSLCLATLILSSLPVGLPVGLLVLGALAVSGVGLGAAPTLVWVVIQATRPVLVPAVYALFRDLWDADGPTPGVPVVLRDVMALTRPLPKFGRWE